MAEKIICKEKTIKIISPNSTLLFSISYFSKGKCQESPVISIGFNKFQRKFVTEKSYYQHFQEKHISNITRRKFKRDVAQPVPYSAAKLKMKYEFRGFMSYLCSKISTIYQRAQANERSLRKRIKRERKQMLR